MQQAEHWAGMKLFYPPDQFSLQIGSQESQPRNSEYHDDAERKKWIITTPACEFNPRKWAVGAPPLP